MTSVLDRGGWIQESGKYDEGCIIISIRRDNTKKGGAMHIVHVFVHIKAGKVEEFKQATIENARNSLKEPGVARFDFIQQVEDPSRFVLVEVYKMEEDSARHKKTSHYNLWRETVEALMVEPRSRVVYRNVFPDESGWD